MATFMRYIHKADVYIKTVVVSASGQEKPTWTLTDQSVPCIYFPVSTDIRLTPTIGERDKYKMMFPAEIVIDYGTRIYNIVDRWGNVIDPGPLEIVSFLKQEGFSGKIHHLALEVRRVIQ